VCDVVGVHARDDRSAGLVDDQIRAADRPKIVRRLEQAGALVLRRPGSQLLTRAVPGIVVEDDEFEIAKRLAEDALDRLVQIGKRVSHRHDHG
jgi:hypothetical protein